MKRGTPEHPQVLMLADALDCHRLTALGIIHSLWQWTAAYTPLGNVGKYPDHVIQRGVGYADDWLVGALTEAGIVERDEEARLLVADWDEILMERPDLISPESGQ